MPLYTIETRVLVEINTDPQRRCYYGTHASSELVWSEWAGLHSDVPQDAVDRHLKFWRDLNEYAVSQRGKPNTLREYRAVPQKEGV